MQNVNDVIALMKTPSQADLSAQAGRELISRAFAFSQKAHEGQKRFSGEPYFNHTFEAAKQLAALGMDAETIAAGLLHDTVEDGNVTLETLEREFGKEVAFLVDGVTKLGKIKYRGIERYTESLRKLLLATSKDVRVLIIKFADRLHNMQTLEHVREDKRARIALETLEIYAPLANRLGMGRLKGELEDLAFPYVYPKQYAEVTALLGEHVPDAQARLEKIHDALAKELAKQHVETIMSDYRVKRLYSLWKKLQRQDMQIEKIYDISALRIIVPTIADCYRVLGIIHSLWRPLPGRIKDYIAFPKPNGYQSLHTTVFTGDGGVAEIQIRTKEMHDEAEFGIASHLGYKENITQKKGQMLSKKLTWIQELTEWQRSIKESGEFLDRLKKDFFSDRVFIFTPKGDVIDLPVASTPIDFAYAIHSDIGNHAAGSRVNGKMVALDTILKNGDIVEIVIKRSSKPSAKWLNFAKTTLARKHIKQATSPAKKES